MNNVGILINLDAYKIQQYQQNRYPCFFVDVIEEAVPGKSAKGYKNFTFNEWFSPRILWMNPTCRALSR